MKPMKTRYVALFLAFIMTFAFAACSEANNREGQAKTPSASSAQKGKNYQDVIATFGDCEKKSVN